MEEKEHHFQQKKNNLTLFLLLILIGGILTLISLNIWQSESCRARTKVFNEEKEKLEKEISSLKQQLEELKISKEEIEKKNCKGLWKNGVCLLKTCIDSDADEKPNDIYIKGSVTYTDEDGVERVVYDECSGDNKQVNEMWCYESPAGSGNYVPGRQVFYCKKGCLDGACQK